MSDLTIPEAPKELHDLVFQAWHLSLASDQIGSQVLAAALSVAASIVSGDLRAAQTNLRALSREMQEDTTASENETTALGRQ